MDLSAGVYILVEPSSEGQGCQLVISDHGQRHIPSEAMALEFRLATLMAREMCELMGLPRGHWWVTREAMLANMSSISDVARRALAIIKSTNDDKGEEVIQAGAD